MNLINFMSGTVSTSKRQQGVTMIEYALIAALIAVVSIVALTTLGGDIKTKFEAVGTAVKDAGK